MRESEPRPPKNPFEGMVKRDPVVVNDKRYVHYGNFRVDTSRAIIAEMYMEFSRRGLGIVPEQKPQDRYGTGLEGLAFYRDERLSYQDIWLLEHAEPLAFLPEDFTANDMSQFVDKAIVKVGLAEKLHELGLA